MHSQPGSPTRAAAPAYAPEESETSGLSEPIGITVVTDGSIVDSDVRYAIHRLSPVVEKIGEPVLFTRVKLSMAPDPARPRPALAQILVDIRGDLVRAQVAAETMVMAIDLLKERLRDKLNHRLQRRRALRRRPDNSEPGTWRRGDLPASRPDYFDRPPEERELVRRKTFAIDALSPDEAIFDMEQLDHEFYLFVDLASDQDALLERVDHGSYRLTRLHPVDIDPGPTAEPLEVADRVPPTMSEEEATARLDATGARYLFFINAITARGNVVYHRYDGHYGLITPE